MDPAGKKPPRNHPTRTPSPSSSGTTSNTSSISATSTATDEEPGSPSSRIRKRAHQIPSLPTIPSGCAIEDQDETRLTTKSSLSSTLHSSNSAEHNIEHNIEHIEHVGNNGDSNNTPRIHNNISDTNIINTATSDHDDVGILIETQNKEHQTENLAKRQKYQLNCRKNKVTIEPNSCTSFLSRPNKPQQQQQPAVDYDDKDNEEEEENDDIDHRQPTSICISLPPNQYECILRRRATVKEEDRIKHFEMINLIPSPTSISSILTKTTTKVSKRRTLFLHRNIEAIATPTIENTSTNGLHRIIDRNPEEELYGDTTVGMKLTILSGMVIVQNIIPLNDGRASPAQLSGLIHRGDVILSINGKSLSSLPFENINILVDRLAPLSHPSSSDGLVFDREVRIRFEIGSGMKILDKDENKIVNDAIRDADRQGRGDQTTKTVDGAGDLFNVSKYTFVDQLSGRPMFTDDDLTHYPPEPSSSLAESQIIATPKTKNERKQDKKQTKQLQLKKSIVHHQKLQQYRSQQSLLDYQLSNISVACNIERVLDLMKYSSSGYFLLNHGCSSILRKHNYAHVALRDKRSNPQDETVLTPKEMIDIGNRVLIGTNRILELAEMSSTQKKSFDPMKMVYDECHSFSSKSRFSRRSKCSQRKRFLFQGISQDDSVHITTENDESSASSGENDLNDSDSLISNDLGEGSRVGGDGMLLRLAVWNKTWKEQMVETIDAASVHKVKNNEEKKTEDMKQKKANNLESHLQSLFFGDKILDAMSLKKPATLPPEEMTEVVYDLALSVSSTVPLNVNVQISGTDATTFKNITLCEHDEILSPRLSSSKKNSELYEATRFLIDEIIPSWLNTFKPIKMQQRRVLWSLNKDGSSGLGTPDDLSESSSMTGWSANSPGRREKLEDRVVSIELDSDTKLET
jgi:hypothetical protein